MIHCVMIFRERGCNKKQAFYLVEKAGPESTVTILANAWSRNKVGPYNLFSQLAPFLVQVEERVNLDTAEINISH